MRILVLSLEFTAATFSGNGVYCQSQVGCRARPARWGSSIM